jgi:hypothetical protein
MTSVFQTRHGKLDGRGRGAKILKKTVDRKADWVYIHDCHPQKGRLQVAILRTYLSFPASYLSWCSSVDALLRAEMRRNGNAGCMESQGGNLYLRYGMMPVP